MATLQDLASSNDLDAALAHPGPVILDVYTQSCIICRRIEPMVAAVASASQGAIRAHKIDAEKHVDFAVKHDIRGVPTLLLFRDGKLAARRSGFLTASELREWVGRESNA